MVQRCARIAKIIEPEKMDRGSALGGGLVRIARQVIGICKKAGMACAPALFGSGTACRSVTRLRLRPSPNPPRDKGSRRCWR